MLASNEQLSQGTDRLKQINAVTSDIESTANSILGDLVIDPIPTVFVENTTHTLFLTHQLTQT